VTLQQALRLLARAGSCRPNTCLGLARSRMSWPGNASYDTGLVVSIDLTTNIVAINRYEWTERSRDGRQFP
jgi:hypothetical protein